jgi:DNA polymerase III subunit delta
MATTPDSIIKDIRKGNIKPVYLLTGEESYFIDRVLDVLQKELIPEDEIDFNRHILYGLDTNFEQIVSFCKSYPMMGDRQAVFVREAQACKDWDDRTKEKVKLKTLSTYLKNPQPTTVLVLVYRHKKIDNRLEPVKLIKEKGVYFESEKMRDYQMPGWVEKRATELGMSIEPEASRLIVDHIGANPANINMELEKLSILKKGATISKSDISQHIGISKDFNVFELQKALFAKDVLLCNRILKYFQANPKDNPIQMTLPVLHGYFVKLGQYMELAAEDPGDSQLASKIGVNPYFLKEYASAGRLYSLPKIRRIMGYFLEADRMSKGVGNPSLDTDDIMKELVFKILH